MSEIVRNVRTMLQVFLSASYGSIFPRNYPRAERCAIIQLNARRRHARAKIVDIIS